MTDFHLDDFMPYQLAVLSSKISREFAELYTDRFGLSVPEWRLVAHLSQTRDPVSVREIFERVDMDKSKVSRAASRLERRGYVIKSVNPADRRLVELRLSEKGRAMVDELAPLARQYDRQCLEALGESAPAFREAVRALLESRRPSGDTQRHG